MKRKKEFKQMELNKAKGKNDDMMLQRMQVMTCIIVYKVVWESL